MISRDETVTLPSGTEISVEAAIGDIARMADDLRYVAELLTVLAPLHTHTMNGFAPDWVKAINDVLHDREVDVQIKDIDHDIWDRFIGPMCDFIERGEAMEDIYALTPETKEGGWTFIGQNERVEADKCDCPLCLRIAAEGVEPSSQVGYLRDRVEQEIDASRLKSVLEQLDPHTLAIIWRIARPGDGMPADSLQRGYGLYEWFSGC